MKAELDSTDFSRTGNIGSLSEDRSRELKSGSESTNESNASGFESEALVPVGIAAFYKPLDKSEITDLEDKLVHIKLVSPSSKKDFEITQEVVQKVSDCGQYFYIASFNYKDEEGVDFDAFKSHIEKIELSGLIHDMDSKLEELESRPEYFSLLFSSVIEPGYIDLLFEELYILLKRPNLLLV